MRRSEAVLQAIETGFKAVLAGQAEVGRNIDPPSVITDPLVIIRDGDPGKPEVLMSPRAFSYEHAFRVEVGAATSAQREAVLAAVDGWIEANRGLNGLTDWLEAATPETEVEEPSGAAPLFFALFDLTASYTIPTPLS